MKWFIGVALVVLLANAVAGGAIFKRYDHSSEEDSDEHYGHHDHHHDHDDYHHGHHDYHGHHDHHDNDSDEDHEGHHGHEHFGGHKHGQGQFGQGQGQFEQGQGQGQFGQGQGQVGQGQGQFGKGQGQFGQGQGQFGQGQEKFGQGQGQFEKGQGLGQGQLGQGQGQGQGQLGQGQGQFGQGQGQLGQGQGQVGQGQGLSQQDQVIEGIFGTDQGQFGQAQEQQGQFGLGQQQFGQTSGQDQRGPTQFPAQTQGTTQSNNVRDCIRRCPVTSEFNPVCGTNNVTYNNPGRLDCAQNCGVDVTLLRTSSCNVAESVPSAPVPSLLKSSSDSTLIVPIQSGAPVFQELLPVTVPGEDSESSSEVTGAQSGDASTPQPPTFFGSQAGNDADIVRGKNVPVDLNGASTETSAISADPALQGNTYSVTELNVDDVSDIFTNNPSSPAPNSAQVA